MTTVKQIKLPPEQLPKAITDRCVEAIQHARSVCNESQRPIITELLPTPWVFEAGTEDFAWKLSNKKTVTPTEAVNALLWIQGRDVLAWFCVGVKLADGGLDRFYDNPYLVHQECH